MLNSWVDSVSQPILSGLWSIIIISMINNFSIISIRNNNFNDFKHNFPREKLFSIKRNSWVGLFIYKQLSTWVALLIVNNSLSWFMTNFSFVFITNPLLGSIKLITRLSANVMTNIQNWDSAFCWLACRCCSSALIVSRSFGQTSQFFECHKLWQEH